MPLLAPPSPTLSLLAPHRRCLCTLSPLHRSSPPPDLSLHLLLLRRRRTSSARRCTSGIPASIDAPTETSSVESGESKEEAGFIEVGYVSSVHGIKGEMRLKSTTDFPQLRFSEPGRRWLRSRIQGKESISEVELTGGRGHPGQKGWIISLNGIDTVEKAKKIVGATLLVKEDDRPQLEEGEFYTPDLIGMRVVLKETGRIVGTVVKVINTGASDLLQVMLNSAVKRQDLSSSSTSGRTAPDLLVWIPFVEAIVPDVDINSREMQITPPKGLLELNLRSDARSKKERRQMEWKERKKLKQRLVSAKKKVCDLGQKHLLEGFSFGDKPQKSVLAKQIVDINFTLFKNAMQSVDMSIGRHALSEFITANSAELLMNSYKISQRCFITCASERMTEQNNELHSEGLQLLMKSKVAIIVVINEENIQGCGSQPDDVSAGRLGSKVLKFQELFLECKRFLKMEDQAISIPIILVSPANEIQSYEELLSDMEYFNFDSQKVQFLEEEKLPIFGTFADEKSNKILLKTPWEILQAPVGSGGVFSLLLTHKILDDLTEQGVEYVQVCSLSGRPSLGHPLFFGLVKSRGGDMGIKISEGRKEDEGEYDIIFSARYLNRIVNQADKIQKFYAVPERNPHVELVEKEWIEVEPDAPNSYRLQCSIWSSLNACSLDRVCVMNISSE